MNVWESMEGMRDIVSSLDCGIGSDEDLGIDLGIDLDLDLDDSADESGDNDS